MTIAAPRGKRIESDDDFYPSSDGKPMAETDKHIDLIIYCKEALRLHFADSPDVYIAGNNFVFYQEGDPGKRVSPDGYVVFGAAMRQRNSYKAWEEGGKLPSVVFEFTSKKTRKEDTHSKRPLYESVLRVPEYFLFDPTGDYLRPRLQGYRLNAEGRYEPIPLVEGRLYSEQLNLELISAGETFRLFDPVTGETLLSPLEQAQRAEAEEKRANAEAKRANIETERANTEAERAAAAERAAETERQARLAVEAELARLREEVQNRV